MVDLLWTSRASYLLTNPKNKRAIEKLEALGIAAQQALAEDDPLRAYVKNVWAMPR